MTPERLAECLSTIRWNPSTLAEAMDVPAQAVADWLSGGEDIPRKVAAWLDQEAVAATAAAEGGKTQRHSSVRVASCNFAVTARSARPFAASRAASGIV